MIASLLSSASLAFLVLGASALPSPAKRAPAIDDTVVLNFALTLEHLEDAFYKEGLSRFSEDDFAKDGLPPFARGRFTQVADHERLHVELLEKVLGKNATKPCTYDFGFKDPKSFVALSQALEGVGVSAYAGAAQLLSDKNLLTTAAVILSTEARHASFVHSAVSKGSGWSGAFDVALGINKVFSLAAPFIKECPSTNPALPVTAFPPLTIADARPGSKSKLTFKTEGAPPPEPHFVAFFTGLDTLFVEVKDGAVEVPSQLLGVVYAVVTTSDKSTEDDKIVAGPAILDFDFDSNEQLID